MFALTFHCFAWWVVWPLENMKSQVQGNYGKYVCHNVISLSFLVHEKIQNKQSENSEASNSLASRIPSDKEYFKAQLLRKFECNDGTGVLISYWSSLGPLLILPGKELKKPDRWMYLVHEMRVNCPFKTKLFAIIVVVI